MWWLAQAVPPDIAGLPTWALNGLSIGSLVMMIVVGLVTSRLWTKAQVDVMRQQFEENLTNQKNRYEQALVDQRDRYEIHITRTVELYRLHADEAVRREKEWRDTALLWQKTAEALGDGLEPVQEQSATMLAIIQAWQSNPRPGRGR